MEFRVLGPLEVVVDNERLRLGGIRQQTVLAMLLLEVQRTVTVDRLVEGTYGDGPPATARVQVQICISALRRLFAQHSDSVTIETRAQGYLLQIPPTSLDLTRFDALIQNARQTREAGAASEAAACYRAAL